MSLLEIFQDLLRIRSFSGREEHLAEYILRFAAEHSIPAAKQDGNVVYSFTGGSKRCLILNGHMDTVRPGPLERWEHPPCGDKAGVVEDGRVYGLGASDMKASLAVFLYLAREFVQSPPPLDLFFAFVTEEEIGGFGSRLFVNYFQREYRNSYDEVACLLGEPTNNTFCELGHRGNIFLEVKTTGDGGHGARPEQIKEHAIERMLDVIPKVQAVGREWEEEFRDPTLGSPSVTLTGVDSGEHSPNVVPASCRSIWDVRTTPKLHDHALAALRTALGDAAQVKTVNEPSPFSVTAAEERIVVALQEIVPNLETKIARGANDSCMFTSVGIPSLTFGPGRKEVIHRENEYAELAMMEQACSIYRDFIKAF